METIVQILEAEKLAPLMYIPSEMRHSHLEVTLRLVDGTTIEERKAGKINKEIMQKFLKAAEFGEAKENLKSKLAEGKQFDFDAEKIINGTMSEDDWQNLYALQKQAWPNSAVKKTGNDNA